MLNSMYFLIMKQQIDESAFNLPKTLFLRPNANRLLRRAALWGHITAAFKEHGNTPDSKHNFVSQSFCLNLVLRGTGRYIHNTGETYPLKPGYVFIREPNTSHSTLIDAESDYAEWFVVYDAATANVFNAIGIAPPACVFSVGCNSLLLDKITEITECIRQPQDKISPVGLQLRLASFLDYLYQRANHNRESDTWSRVVEEACEWLDNPEHDWIDLEQLATQLGVAYPSFRRAFTELKGMPPGEYRIRHRLNRACHLLAENSVKATSERLCYADPFAFSAQFKRYMGISPSDYQQSIGKR